MAHPARVRIVELLREGERCVCELAPKVGISDSNLSQHLGILRKAGLVETRREGHAVYYRVSGPGVIELADTGQEIVRGRLATISAMLEQAR